MSEPLPFQLSKIVNEFLVAFRRPAKIMVIKSLGVVGRKLKMKIDLAKPIEVRDQTCSEEKV